MDHNTTDVSLPKHLAWLSTCGHNHVAQQRDVVSLACGGPWSVDDGGIHPRHRSTQGIQPQGMDVVVF